MIGCWCPGGLVGSINNLAIQYNFAAASVAIEVLRRVEPRPQWAHFTLLGTVFVGAVIGMVVVGSLGDWLGRRPAMLLTLSFTLVGALGCAVLPQGEPTEIYATISACRLVLGVGVGGLYPLSAARTAESDSEPDASKIGWSFGWQSVGALIPYLVAWALHSAQVFDDMMQFRIIFGLGAIPVLIVIALEAVRAPESTSLESKAALRREYTLAMQGGSRHWRHLIGTAGTWFLFDVAYYGTAIFQPQILQSIFHTTELSYSQNLIIGVMGLPGPIAAVLSIPYIGLRNLNTGGFLLTVAAFAALAVAFMVSPDGIMWVKFGMYCVITFSINAGCNIATYVIPATLYPKEVRATFHGMSAGGGKLGAVVGTFMFAPIRQHFGIATVLWTQAVLSFLGAIVSHVFIPADPAAVDPSYAALPQSDSADAIN